MDGEVITAMRTAAVSAIATKYLAEKYDILAVLGSGVQATAHIEAFCKMFPIKKVLYGFLIFLIFFCKGNRTMILLFPRLIFGIIEQEAQKS